MLAGGMTTAANMNFASHSFVSTTWEAPLRFTW